MLSHFPIRVIRDAGTDHVDRLDYRRYREDDKTWPKKNIIGKQELEIKMGNYHISFEVRSVPLRSLPIDRRRLTSNTPPDGENWIVG